jgi:hypothetical protein
VLAELTAPTVAGWTAAERTPGRGSHARQAATAGLCTGAAAALLATTLGVSTFALLPRHVRLEVPPPGMHVPAGIHPPSNVDESVDKTTGKYYILLLLFGPLIGAGLGAAGRLNDTGHGGGGGDSGGGDQRRPAARRLVPSRSPSSGHEDELPVG